MSNPQLRALRCLTLALLGLSALAACVASGDNARSPAPVPGAREQRAWDELNEQKAEVEATRQDPVVISLPDGEITVREWHLEGGPDWEYVRTKFTYENTTDTPMAEVQVELRVLDASGVVRGASHMHLVHPLGWALRPGTSFGEELRATTNGAHRESGWYWTMTCVGEREGRTPP
jgi:hypothetical protein